MFEVREVETNAVCAIRSGLGRACDTADVFHIGTGKDYCVVKLEVVYSTHESSYALRPGAEVLSRAAGSLKAKWERFRSLRDKLVTPNG